MAFVFAVSLAQLLLRISALVVARKRVTFSGLSCLAMACAILLVYLNWLSLWELRGAKDWNLLSMTVTFFFALSICFTCTLAAPHTAADGATDMEAFYWQQRKPFYCSWIACEILAIVANALFRDTPNASKLMAENLVRLPDVPTAHTGAGGAQAVGTVARRRHAVRDERGLSGDVRGEAGIKTKVTDEAEVSLGRMIDAMSDNRYYVKFREKC